MIQELRNNLDFFIRNLTKFSRKDFVEKDKNILERIRKENLYTLDTLEQFFIKIPRKNSRILDIGCKNWFYAKGEYEFFQTFCEDFTLDGVEIDAYRLYSNLYSRYETAKFYTKGLSNTNYIADNLLNIKKKYDYIIWILPFVTIEPLRYWGLPQKLFMPEKLLNHAYSLLNSNGQMLILNQGREEEQKQKQLLVDLNIPFKELGEIKSRYFEYKNKRYGFIITKEK